MFKAAGGLPAVGIVEQVAVPVPRAAESVVAEPGTAVAVVVVVVAAAEHIQCS